MKESLEEVTAKFLVENKKNDMSEVVNLFMNNSDLEALNLLYNITKDSLVKILIDWCNNYSVQELYTDVNSMYTDMIDYIFSKYNLNNI